ncbi:MAG: hypothetical protein Q7U68_05070, partial [Candidatus Roizmanbacteria bacterium]|nr:hypothetical protein [Candidatus Roizmanbacteria bacterium]
RKILFPVFLLFLLSFSIRDGTAQEKKGIGLSVEPGGLLIQKVPIGQLYDMDYWIKMRFKVYNNSDKARRYMLKVDKAVKVGVKVLKGYSDIPNPSWFWFEKNELLVPANGAEEIKMFLRIPDEEKYCNQKWAVGIDVEGRPEAEERLVLAVSPVFYIETENRAEVKEKPAGFLGLVPGTVILENAALGKNKGISKIKIYNNDSQPHLYRISSIIPYAESGRQVITPSPNFSWMPKEKWLKPNKSILKIAPYEQAEITLDLDIPKKTEFLNQRWEGVLFFESEEGLANFVRVQIKTTSQ